MYSINPFRFHSLPKEVFEPSFVPIQVKEEQSANSVYASCGLSKGLCSKVIDICELNDLECGSVESRILIELSDDDLTLVSTNCSQDWVKSVQLAKDIHSFNVILEKLDSNKLVLRTVKSIQEGEELIMWFSENLQALIGIPFLTPTNIQDQNRYVCHHCQKIFENPNPLKIHLATNCDKLSKEILWTRLIEQSQPIKVPTPTSTLFFSPSPTLQQYEHLRFSDTATLPVYSSLSHHTIQPWMHQDRVSAFRPVASVSPQPISTSSSSSFISNTDHQSILQAAARLETIVSNMGTSKQGHICIYCGKLYSRKYGLKIHIRTHTGFKPLKCKYCYRPFGDPSNLNKHVRLHVQSNSIYKCTLCNKILVRRRDLQRHLQTRHSSELMSGGGGSGNRLPTGTSKTVVHHLSSSILSSSSSSDDDENDGVHYLPS